MPDGPELAIAVRRHCLESTMAALTERLQQHAAYLNRLLEHVDPARYLPADVQQPTGVAVRPNHAFARCGEGRG